MHDAVAGWDDEDIVERELRPVDEVEAILVTTILNGAVFLEGLRVEASGPVRLPSVPARFSLP